ncbi:hypothetical protein DFH09DRAFT_1315101 [Mycena vulgaris]|nr:hypothetical protein DFH09DRAFT_1315101 [Mycena vulgaris]
MSGSPSLSSQIRCYRRSPSLSQRIVRKILAFSARGRRTHAHAPLELPGSTFSWCCLPPSSDCAISPESLATPPRYMLRRRIVRGCEHAYDSPIRQMTLGTLTYVSAVLHAFPTRVQLASFTLPRRDVLVAPTLLNTRVSPILHKAPPSLRHRARPHGRHGVPRTDMRQAANTTSHRRHADATSMPLDASVRLASAGPPGVASVAYVPHPATLPARCYAKHCVRGVVVDEADVPDVSADTAWIPLAGPLVRLSSRRASRIANSPRCTSPSAARRRLSTFFKQPACRVRVARVEGLSGPSYPPLVIPALPNRENRAILHPVPDVRAAPALRHTHSALEYSLPLPDPALACLARSAKPRQRPHEHRENRPPVPHPCTPSSSSTSIQPLTRASTPGCALFALLLVPHMLPLGSLEIGGHATRCPTSPKIGTPHLSTCQGRGRPLSVLVAVFASFKDPAERSLPLRGWPFPPLVAMHTLPIAAQAPNRHPHVQPLTTTRALPRAVLSLPV